jgi:competence protein ComEC
MAGIIVCLSLSATSEIPYYIWAGLLLLTIAVGFVRFDKPRSRNHWLFGILASVFLFTTGYNSVLLHTEILRPTHFSNTACKGTYLAMVSEPLQEKDHSYKTILQIKGIRKGNSILKAEGRVLTYFAKDSIIKPPTEGSTIVFSGTMQEISPPQNPGAFDYKKYMATSNVYHQVYLNRLSWKMLEKPQGFSLYRTAHAVSRNFVKTLNDNGLKGQEFAVAAALLLGQNDMLDNETRQAYSGSGVTHILSVSGLHVGVIFIIINFLLGFMKKKGRQLFLKTFLILATIWAYALLTGMSPPVLRSAAMFTFISIGNASRRYVHIINSLAVSAMLLLLIDPLMISNIGFQLSYLAIVGIVFFNKPIADLWNPGNKIADEIWGLIAVSLAAQLATAPLTMLYFHQFPAYFIPANLIAIPLSFLAIYSGVAVLATSAIPLISSFLGLITNYLLFFLNYSVGFIERLPYSVLSITNIFNQEMILLYLILISLLLLFYYKRKGIVFITLGLGLLLSASFSLTEIKRHEQRKIIFYSSGKQSAIGFLNGKEETLFADTALMSDKTACKFQLDGAKAVYGVTTATVFATAPSDEYQSKIKENAGSLRCSGNHLLFQGKRIVIIDSLPKPYKNVSRLYTDFLVIRHSPKFHIDDLRKLYQTGMIIIDGSNSYYRTEKWLSECKKAGIKAYSLKNSGAYVADL